MLSLSAKTIFKSLSVTNQILKEIHFKSSTCLDHKWRENNKLPKNLNSFGPLTNLPDYSFKDGRPVPYGSNQRRQIDKQREWLLKIKELADQVDFAVERHELLQKQKVQDKQKILDQKLKEKGSKLLQNIS